MEQQNAEAIGGLRNPLQTISSFPDMILKSRSLGRRMSLWLTDNPQEVHRIVTALKSKNKGRHFVIRSFGCELQDWPGWHVEC